jgi:DNA-binding NarL/FixJ family response regulator
MIMRKNRRILGTMRRLPIRWAERVPMTVRIIIADAQHIVRYGIQALLQPDTKLEVVGEAIDEPGLLLQVRHLQPDIVVMDLLLPPSCSVETIRTIRREFPATEVFCFTGVPEDRGVVEALHAGAIGYLHKDANAEALRRALPGAAAGRHQVSADAERIMWHDIREPDRKSLTAREQTVLAQLVDGKSNKEIAHELGIRESTVKSHVRGILSKLDVHTRTQAVLRALHNRLV